MLASLIKKLGRSFIPLNKETREFRMKNQITTIFVTLCLIFASHFSYAEHKKFIHLIPLKMQGGLNY